MSSHQTGGEQPPPDYGSYIDFADLQLDLSAFDIEAAGNILDFDQQHAQHHHQQQQQEQHHHHDHHHQQQQHQQQHQHQQEQQEQQEQQQRQQHQQRHDQPMYEEHDLPQQQLAHTSHHEDMSPNHVKSGSVSSASNSTVSSGVIPPTPSSLDFVSGASNPNGFRSPSGLIDPYSMRDVMMFTPLLSPAVTPIENPMSMQKEYGYPSTYFSPLTSPALEAQSYPFHNSSASPPGNDNNTKGPTKLRRRTAGGYGPPSAASSPAQNVTRVTKGETPAQRSSKRRATAAFTQSNQPNTVGDVSSSESISPEPLLTLPESSMAPPPVPV
ncbi:hypothetical protein V1506DRAFT_508914, partial [Lipomyces tetrasporus]